MPKPIRRRRDWWQEQPDGSWLKWNEEATKWEPQPLPPPPPSSDDLSRESTARVTAPAITLPNGKAVKLAQWPQRVQGALYDIGGMILGAIAIAVLVRLFSWSLTVDPVNNSVAVLGGIGLFLGVSFDNGEGSPGHERFGMQLRRLSTGDKVSATQARVRHVVSIALWLLPLLGLINILWPLWDRNHQALHDKMFDTVVITLK